MPQFGVMIRNQLPVESTLDRLHAQGVHLVQLWCLGNELDVRRPCAADVARVRTQLARLDVKVSAICCDTGLGFVRNDVLDEQFRVLRAACELGRQLGVGTVTSHFGAFDGKDAAALRDTLRRVGDICDEHGVTFATETGAESGPVLRALLDAVNHDRVRVNFDPANLVRRRLDLREAVEQLGPFIVHAHAKDGVRDGDEVVIGSGDVPWTDYLGWLDAAGYDGPMVVEREVDAGWFEDVLAGYRFLCGQTTSESIA